MRLNLVDSQQALGFMIQQATSIETEVYKIQYPDLIYDKLCPIDTSAAEWAKSITYFSIDRKGQADWFDGMANNMRMADVNRAKHEQTIEMAGIGYRYSLEEISQAMLIPGTNLTSERAESAVRAYEEFLDRIVRFGDSRKKTTGMFNNPYITVVDAIADGTGSSPLWANKTADQILRDVNNQLTAVYGDSNTVEMADTLLLPISQWQQLSITRVPNTFGSALDYLQKYNIYTSTTGQPLMIRGVLNLDHAGVGNTARMMTYRRDPRILKLHLPMEHRFLPVFQTGPITYDVPGIFRVGAVEVRRPAACLYLDGI